mmetsp:Transcript_1236/g.2094  ORF Transcript_1236/g.2094 Transcript_1236/m.2094 type:complete len:240 (+) Transcript_1236:205-924(+)
MTPRTFTAQKAVNCSLAFNNSAITVSTSSVSRKYWNPKTHLHILNTDCNSVDEASSAACCCAGVYESDLSRAFILVNSPRRRMTGVRVFVTAFLSVPGEIPSGGTLELNSRDAVTTSGTQRIVFDVGSGCERREVEERLRQDDATRPRRFRCQASMVSGPKKASIRPPFLSTTSLTPRGSSLNPSLTPSVTQTSTFPTQSAASNSEHARASLSELMYVRELLSLYSILNALDLEERTKA